MAQLQKGTNYVLGDTVTPTNLNALVDSAVLLPGAITDQSAKATPVGADSVLLHSLADSALRKATLTDLGAAISAASATTATRLATARTLALTGAVEGSGSFDGSANLTITTAFAAVTVPTGSVLAFGAASAPTGYLACDGALVNRTTYAPLFTVLGTTYGVGDGATTFNLPDLRGEFIRGWDNGRGVDSGRAIGSAQADEFENHQHEFGGDSGVQSQGGYTSLGSIVYDSGYSTSAGNGTRIRTKDDSTNFGGTETRPRNVALHYIIKT